MAHADQVHADRDEPGHPAARAVIADEEEFLDDGRTSAPRWLRPPTRERAPNRWWRAGYVFLAVVVVIAVIRQVGMSDATPQSQASTSTPPPSTTASSVANPDRVSSDALPGPVDSIRALVSRPPGSTDLVRQNTPAGQCPLVTPGRPPESAIVHQARKILGRVSLIDAQRTLDGSTGLCALTLRARLTHATLAVSVTAPGPPSGGSPYSTLSTGPAHPSERTGAATQNGVTTEYALAKTTRGWRVLVGASGTRESLPDLRLLSALAAADALTW